ncbi:MAG: glycosyltransferase family 2 protein [Pseudomonadota bacterium]
MTLVQEPRAKGDTQAVSDDPALSVVVPCFNEEENLKALLDRTRAAAEASFGEDYEIVLVDDGSNDRTWPMIEEAAEASAQIIAIKLSRNHGHQIALTSGLALARGEVILVIDADLQDPPELLADMLATMRAEGADVVYGKRKTRKGETWFKKASASLFYRLLARNAEIQLPLDAGDFRLMTRRVAQALVAMPEGDRFVRGMVSWIGLKQVAFEYTRDERHAGETKYPLRKMLRLAAHAFMGFSMLPLRFAARFAAIMFFFMIAFMIYALASWLLFETVSGWTSLMIMFAFSSAMQFLVLSVLGEYVGRTYLASKGRPLFIVDQVAGAPLARVDEARQSARNPGVWL